MPVIIDTRGPRHTGLNRTFYGIEKMVVVRPSRRACSLNRTFYGIEKSAAAARAKSTDGLNRTFYGIENRLDKLETRNRNVS